MRRRVFFASALLGSAAPVWAQRFGLTHQMLPPDRDLSTAVAFGDLDGDGDLDQFRATAPDPPRICLNDGAGVFTDLSPLVVSVWQSGSGAVALGDVDGDGDLDAFVANSGQDQLFLNGGGGVFLNATATNLPVQGDYSYAVALGDVDGDGDLDAFVGSGGQNRLYLNGGTGVFTDATAINVPPAGGSAVALGDVDGDGDLDAFIGGGSQTLLYLNGGTGVFTNVTGINLPPGGSSVVALGDVDGDGDLDAFLGVSGPATGPPGQTRLYLNAGTGVFADVTATNLPAAPTLTTSIALGDVDGDGDLDALVADSGGPNTPPSGQSRLFLNGGTGVFTDATTTNLPVLLDRTAVVALGDVDGDGDLDAFIGNAVESSFLFFPAAPARGEDRLLLNNGNGTFTDVTSTIVGFRQGQTWTVALGDLDGDGDLDAFAGNSGQDRLYLRGDGGLFADVTATNLPGLNGQTLSIALGDVDGDGDLDVLLGRANTGNPLYSDLTELYSNAGNGVFTDVTASNLPFASELEPTRAVALGDLDGDGDLDGFVGKGSQCAGCPGIQNRLLRNTGGGQFTDATLGNLPSVLGDTRAVALGDLDGDGDLDALVGSSVAGADRLLLNSGTGSFADVTAGSLPALPGSTSALALGDVDGDGDLDAVVGKDGQDRLLLNAGTGVFTTTNLSANVDPTAAVALGDVDGDGDLDALAAIGGYGTAGELLLHLNGGTGAFLPAPMTALPFLMDTPQAVALGDVDGDGDFDAFVGAWGPERLYTNLARQSSWRGIPRMGKPLSLDVDGPANGTWLLAASAGNASIPLPPFGTLRLFPPTLFFVAGGVLDLQGRASVTFPVPANPALVGQSLFWQAVVGPPLRFTNLEVTTVTNL